MPRKPEIERPVAILAPTPVSKRDLDNAHKRARKEKRPLKRVIREFLKQYANGEAK